MRKSEKSIKKAIDRYIADVSERFQGLTFETTLEPEMGVQAWLWIGVEDDLRRELKAYTTQLTIRLLDEQDLNIVAIPTTKKEPVHG